VALSLNPNRSVVDIIVVVVVTGVVMNTDRSIGIGVVVAIFAAGVRFQYCNLVSPSLVAVTNDIATVGCCDSGANRGGC